MMISMQFCNQILFYCVHPFRIVIHDGQRRLCLLPKTVPASNIAMTLASLLASRNLHLGKNTRSL